MVRGHAIGACHQSIAMAKVVLLRQEQWKDLWKKAWARTVVTGPHTTENKKFKHDLREAWRDAKLRTTTQKDLREDAAKGIDKTAFLHLLKFTQWQRGQLRATHMNEVLTCDALYKAIRRKMTRKN